MAKAQHSVLRNRLESYAHKRKQVCDGNGAAFFFRPGPLLNERIHRDDEKASGDAKECQLHQDRPITYARPGKQRGHQKYAAQPRKDHASLDFPA